VLVVVNVAWPRPEVYGTIWYRRFGAPLATAVMLAAGALAYRLVRRSRNGVLDEHRAPASAAPESAGRTKEKDLG
jgi:hypothetical protein